jgi:GNAT superfamily N-acetyltransferase
MNEIQVRRAGPADIDALRRLVSELSLESAHLRFFAGVGTPTTRFLAALLRKDDTHGAWVCTSGYQLLGHAAWARDAGAAEVGVVVADAWQKQGVGRALLTSALAEAARSGLTDVRLHVHPENRWLARRLSRGATTAVLADGMVTVTRPVADLLPAAVAARAS